MGRMGNQMFQYACAKYLEQEHGFICSMDDLSKLEFFELAPGERRKNFWKQKLFFHVGKRFFGMDVYNLDFDDLLKDFRPWLQQLNKPSMIWAYFQSERYFKGIEADIRRYFVVRETYRKDFDAFLQQRGLQAGAYNAIHLRRTDYKGFTVKGLSGDNFTLPLSYYQIALQRLDTSKPTVVVSDDIAFCRAEFGHIPGVLFSGESAIVDFQILTHASSLIISNSTFAWWAAWLNTYAQSAISCPKYFLGFKEHKEVPIHIYPSNWHQVEFSAE